MSTLVVGPFMGELGWELFSWEPYVRGLFLHNQHDKCVVYGTKGKSSLYNFAEYRDIKIIKEDSECNFIHNAEEHRAELDTMLKTLVGRHKQEDGEFQFFWFNNLPRLNDPMYMGGRPDLIEMKDHHPKVFVNLTLSDKQKSICLCVRNRQLSDFRNWDFNNWYDLADKLKDICRVYVVGKIEEDGWEMPDGVVDLTNSTTIDDCINIFGDMDLMVGGSTGLMHLASRMGKPHLVWGVPKNIERYGETNWFGAKHFVYTDKSWMPAVDDIYPMIENFVMKGKFNV